MVEIKIHSEKIKKKKTDSRGRITLGSKYANQGVEVVVTGKYWPIKQELKELLESKKELGLWDEARNLLKAAVFEDKANEEDWQLIHDLYSDAWELIEKIDNGGTDPEDWFKFAENQSWEDYKN